MHKLSARAVAALNKPGVYADGAGLYLRVQRTTARSWIYIFHLDGRRREMGLGAPPSVSLARAWERAQSVREAVADGIDPIAKKRARVTAPTFGELADAFVEDRKSTVRSEKSVARWKRALGQGGYANNLRELRVDQIGTENVLSALRPLWESHPSSAGLLRGYIETVLNIAKVSGHRSGDNPAAWAGHLEHILPARRRLSRGHHAAMPFSDVPAFFHELQANPSVAARALEFTILTAARTSEALKATWDEIDIASEVWTIPAARMKAGKEHRVPLSKAALHVLQAVPAEKGPIFPGRRNQMPLSNMAMDMVLRRLGVEATVHGFRSSFRDWAGEMTATPREVAEAALAHTVGNSAELAYRRGDALAKRRVLMDEWAGFCVERSLLARSSSHLVAEGGGRGAASPGAVGVGA